MKPISVLLALVLLATLGISACTTTEFVHVTPECTPPPQPVLPELSKGDLWESIGDDQYRRLELYINNLWAFSDEQSAMLTALCGDS